MTTTETWIDKSYPCLMLRNNPHMGVWCGYVAVPPGHRLHGADYDDAPQALHRAAHGELTFAGPCDDDPRNKREQVCHVPAPGEPDDVWWFGFDCGHGNDIWPGPISKHMTPMPDAVYRDVTYVTESVTELAAALAR